MKNNHKNNSKNNYHNKKHNPEQMPLHWFFTMAASTHRTLCLPKVKPQSTKQWPQLQIVYSIYRFCKTDTRDTDTMKLLLCIFSLKHLLALRAFIYHWQWPNAVRHVGAIQECWLTFLITHSSALFCKAWADQNNKKKSNPTSTAGVPVLDLPKQN